jgi:hypothetical protein
MFNAQNIGFDNNEVVNLAGRDQYFIYSHDPGELQPVHDVLGIY